MFPMQNRMNASAGGSPMGKTGQIPGASNKQTSPAKIKKKGAAMKKSGGAALRSMQLYPPVQPQGVGYGGGSMPC